MELKLHAVDTPLGVAASKNNNRNNNKKVTKSSLELLTSSSKPAQGCGRETNLQGVKRWYSIHV